MENERRKTLAFVGHDKLIEHLKEEHNILPGDLVLIPAINGRKQKKKTGYGTMVDVVVKQSGEMILLFRQDNKKLLFSIEELERCWLRVSSLIPRVKKGD